MALNELVAALELTSPANPRVKHVVKLRQRSHREAQQQLLIEGYREIKRALENRQSLQELYTCPPLFQGVNETALIAAAHAQGADLYRCSERVFRKMAYRDRPDGLLAVGPQIHRKLQDLILPETPLLVVAEAIEKPGNLGTMLRSADATGADAVIVCDRCTDINNPNVVRASTGALFSVPVAEAAGAETLTWLRQNNIRTVATTPHTDSLFWQADLRGPCAIIVGAEQYGLSRAWLDAADMQVRIPMRGNADSLNVAAATTLLLYEALRQRSMNVTRT